MKRWLVRGVVAVAALGVVIVGGAFLLPSTHTLETTGTVRASPETVFEVLNTLEGERRWWAEAMADYPDAPAMVIEHRGGPEAGPGMRIAFVSDGETFERWTFLEAEAPRRSVVEVDFGIFVVERTLTLTPEDAGTAVRWREVARFDNPLTRYLSLMPSEEVTANFDRAIAALDRVVAP
jgi:uncharacterized protein YndB with AHSA1/START domain